MNGIPFSLFDLIERNASLYKGDEAIVMDGERYSFGDVRHLAAQLAQSLSERGIKSRDRIAILAESSPQFLITLFAACRLGAIMVPLNTRLSEGELRYMLKDTKPSLFIASDNYLNQAQVVADKVKGLPVQTLGDIFAAARKTGEMGDENPVSSQSPCLIIHTAAVGGKARGAVLTHGNLIFTALQLAHLLKLSEEDRHLCLLPLFHIGGIAFSLATFLAGGSTVITPRFEPDKIPPILTKERITFFITFPPMLAAILQAEKRDGLVAPSLRLAGGVDNSETIEDFLSTHRGAIFYQIYGQTECMPVSGGIYRGESGSVGQPALLTRVSIRDEEEPELPPGAVGEICVRSPSVFLGYWRLKGDTDHTFRERWHHTGDLGELKPDGTLLFRGRKPEKDLIKTGGENVYPREVEKVILTHPAIKEACVIGIPDEKWGEAVVAICCLKEGQKLTESEVIEYVGGRIARYKRPRRIIFLNELPKKADGSIDRQQAKKTGVELLAPPPEKTNP